MGNDMAVPCRLPSMKRTLLVLLTVLSSPVAWAQALPTVTVPAEVGRVLTDYARAWAANDAQALSRLFAPEGMALPNGQPPARGADSIRRVYSQGAGSPLALRPISFAASGDLAYVVGGFGPSPDAPDLGKFTLVLRREGDGRWLIVADMDNSNVPVQPVPPRPPRPVGAEAR